MAVTVAVTITMAVTMAITMAITMTIEPIHCKGLKTSNSVAHLATGSPGTPPGLQPPGWRPRYQRPGTRDGNYVLGLHHGGLKRFRVNQQKNNIWG